jgi:DNA-binding transcriptional MerR regulator
MPYRIGEFAKLSGISAKALRFYDQIGLLRPATVDPCSRYRLYQPHQLEQIAAILAYKELGLPLTKIRTVVQKSATATADSRTQKRRMLEDLRDSLTESIVETERSLALVKTALDALEKAAKLTPVVVRHRAPMRVASIRALLDSYRAIEELESALQRSIPDDAVGPTRGVLWHRCGHSGVLEGEAFVELKRNVRPTSGYTVRDLPEITAACAYSGMDDASADTAYSALDRWLTARRCCVRGAKREIYHQSTLEIQYPLQSV